MSDRSWFKDNKPRMLEGIYRGTYNTIRWMQPLFKRIGYERAGKWMAPLERISKKPVFGCQMCGQCILHSTGMVCPMTCPKNLRNGACGGVRSNGNCEVIPDMKCVWVTAYDAAQNMQVFGSEMISIKPPVNHLLEGSSAWMNLLAGTDKTTPEGWAGFPHNPVIEQKFPTREK